MARVDHYTAGSWHEMMEHQEQWKGIGDYIVVIPESEERNGVVQFFPELQSGLIFTIPELVERYVVQCLGKKGIISRHGMESILGSIISEGLVPYFKIERYRQGYTRALTDFLHNFRKTSARDLKSALAHFKTDSSPANAKEDDLLRLYTAYKSRLSGLGHDFKSGLEHFVQHTDEDNIYRHLGVDSGRGIIFWGFNSVTPLETVFIVSLLKNAAGAVFLSCSDPAAAEQSTRVHKSVESLLEQLSGVKLTRTALLSRQDSFFMRLSRRIFENAAKPDGLPGDGGAPSHERVLLARENNRFEEVVSMARKIKYLQEEGASLESMRIVIPEKQLYGAIIREIFPDYGIPFVLEKGLPLLSHPLSSLVHSLANQCVTQNPFPMREKIFSSAYTRFEARVRPAELVDYQNRAGTELLCPEVICGMLPPQGVRGVLDFRFISKLRQDAYRSVDPAQGTPQLEVLRQYFSETGRPGQVEQEKRKLQCLLQFFLLEQAEKGLSAIPSRVSAAGFKTALFTLLHRFHVIETVESLIDHGRPDPLLQKIQAAEQGILREIHDLLEQLISLLAPLQEMSGGKLSRQEVVRIFSRLLGEAHLPAEHREGVHIQPVNRCCYRTFDYTFFCGMVDGEFPPREEFNFLQPKREGLSLGWTYTVVDHARNQFYYLLRSTVKALYMSAPLSHNGKKLPVSPFYVELGKCLYPAGVSGQEESASLALRHVRPLSRREKLVFIGKNLDHNYEETRPLLMELLEEGTIPAEQITEILRFDGMSLNANILAEFDGMIAGDTALEVLREELGRLVYTPALLERYAACPLRFFLDDIMSLKEKEDYDPDTAPGGKVIRSILKAYTERAARNGGLPADAAVFIKELIYGHYDETTAEIRDAFEARFLNGLLAGLEGSAAKRPGLFSSFLAHEKDSPDLLKPYLANLHGTVHLNTDLEIQVEVDRLDLTPASEIIMAYNYSVADTGDPTKIGRGLRFSLPLAFLLIEQYQAEKGLHTSLGGGGVYLVKSPKNIRRGGYFALKSVKAARQEQVCPQRPIFSGQRHGFIADEDFPEALKKIQGHLQRIHQLMKKGVFHLPLGTERDQDCFNCSFGRICRKDQLRLDRLLLNLQHDNNIHIVKEII